MLGIFNWGFDLLERHLSAAITWSDHYHVVRSDYHGFCFEGNGCRRLLQDDSLDFLALTIANAPPSDDKPEANRILAVFRAFAAVRAATYSSELRPNWRDTITHFSDLQSAGSPRKCIPYALILPTGVNYPAAAVPSTRTNGSNGATTNLQSCGIAVSASATSPTPFFQKHHLRAVHRFNTSNIPVASAASELDATDT